MPAPEWSGRLGRLRAELRTADDGRRVLTVGDRQVVVRPDAAVRHRGGLLHHRITVEQPGEPVFTVRYRPSWHARLGPLLDATHDRWAAESDDPGLELTARLGGTDDWVDDRADT
ncbi:hypothetical protein ACFXDE_25165 [Kitasatospora sp. NPDC059408]|uniref:hypothetical protein n=1 Tax=Kitasatospora sp. NPDC059408 TaxID=3346823 RepID=UPI0036966256